MDKKISLELNLDSGAWGGNASFLQRILVPVESLYWHKYYKCVCCPRKVILLGKWSDCGPKGMTCIVTLSEEI